MELAGIAWNNGTLLESYYVALVVSFQDTTRAKVGMEPRDKVKKNPGSRDTSGAFF